MSPKWLGALVGLLLVLGVESAPGDRSELGEVVEADAVLRLAVTSLRKGTDDAGIAGAVAAAAKTGGVEWSRSYRNAGAESDVVVVSRWPSVEAAEAGALALDGSGAEKGLAALGRTKSVRFFRCLRSRSYSETTPGYVEAVIFRTRPQTTRERNVELFDGAEGGFSKGEGLLGHSLWLAPDGTWLHLLHWRAGADYDRTSKALMRNRGVLQWIRSLDFKRFTVTRGSVL